MHTSQLWVFFGVLSLIGQGSTSSTTACTDVKAWATPYLSSNATIQCGVKDVRWSDYAAPQPGAIVTVGTEDDVAKVVAFAVQHNITFLVQSGANGWADTFRIDSDDIVIDISNLKAISFNAAKTEVSFQAGVLIEELTDAAWANNARVGTGTCNCVSVLGAGLGGGLSRTQGLYGNGVDQLLSINYVDAYGNKKTVTPKSNRDLWWAFAGAGPNFGIVTSVLYKSHPVPQAQNVAWTGSLVYNDTQLEAVVSAINDLYFEPEMQLDLTYNSGSIIVIPFYIGNETTGREKFASLLALGPLLDATTVVPYNEWSAAGDVFCVKGGRKPTYGANINTLEPTAWRDIWTEYTSFIAEYPEANASTVLAECYPTTVAPNVDPSLTSYPWRGMQCYVMVIPWYTSTSLDTAGNQFGQDVRGYLNESSGNSQFSAYINFAHGDEALSSIYGSSLPKLKQLKKKYDPLKRFNQWFAL